MRFKLSPATCSPRGGYCLFRTPHRWTPSHGEGRALYAGSLRECSRQIDAVAAGEIPYDARDLATASAAMPPWPARAPVPLVIPRAHDCRRFLGRRRRSRSISRNPSQDLGEHGYPCEARRCSRRSSARGRVHDGPAKLVEIYGGRTRSNLRDHETVTMTADRLWFIERVRETPLAGVFERVEARRRGGARSCAASRGASASGGAALGATGEADYLVEPRGTGGGGVYDWTRSSGAAWCGPRLGLAISPSRQSRRP
jgi:hypothetical protein